ncbi:MAG: class I SAM-dependent methyltransferase [Capsulimonadaceae bacterium]|nr:class I SAM-dependent methyltransferase [Capsulimonadaceae bacterium]
MGVRNHSSQPDGKLPQADQPTAFTQVAPFYDALMAGVPYDYWADYIEQLFARHGIEPDTILDIGCGTGALTIELAERGFRCVGVDLSESMLECARANCSRKALAIEYSRQDAAEFSLPGRRFDAATSLFDSLNNLITPERLTMAFKRVAHHLSVPGIFIFDMNTEYAFTSGMFNQRSTPADGPLQYLWRAHYDRDERICRIDMSFRYEPDGQAPREFHETHVQRAYDSAEIEQWLLASGFDYVWRYDAYTLKSPKRRSDRVFFVASRSLTARPPYVNKVLPVRRRG